jgi:Cu(I)/Ag(I) efflux system protein CusF
MRHSVLAATIGLAVSLSVCAADTGHNKDGMKMEGATAPAPTNQTTGVIKAIDAKSGTVTLSHEPVPAIKWPAMTMPFRISPELARGINVGQRVKVEFIAKGMDGTITKISVLP